MSVLVKEVVEVANITYEDLQWHENLEWLAVTSFSAKKGGEVNFFKQSVSF